MRSTDVGKVKRQRSTARMFAGTAETIPSREVQQSQEVNRTKRSNVGPIDSLYLRIRRGFLEGLDLLVHKKVLDFSEQAVSAVQKHVAYFIEVKFMFFCL